MIKIKNILLKNFLSTGAVAQALNFDRQDLTLILGENMDLGGDGNRNGVGKTVILQALSYALFGASINGIRKDNLINRTNAKGMVVTLEFSVNNIEYRVERGRKPNFLRFYIADALQVVTDEAQGDSRETQVAIEKVLKMSPDMFKHIVVLNTYTDPFLTLKTNEQRDIVEQLLGITMLSEKAELVKAQIGISKDGIKTEEFRLRAVEEANKRILTQIDSLKRRQRLWTEKKQSDLDTLADQYSDLVSVDIERELQAHKNLAIYKQNKKSHDAYDTLTTRYNTWQEKHLKDLGELREAYDKKNSIDIAKELSNHREVSNYNQLLRDKEVQDAALERAVTDEQRFGIEILKLQGEIESLSEHKCYACEQELHDDKHKEVLDAKEESLRTAINGRQAAQKDIADIKENRIELGSKPITMYETEAEAFRHSSELDTISQNIETTMTQRNPYADQLSELKDEVSELMECPITIYDTEAEAVQHQAEVDSLLVRITAKHTEEDPYNDQIIDMEKSAIQPIDFAEINRLTRMVEHQKFLQDLLTSKDSFVRKRIVDQNLVFLNARLTHYLTKLGLPHVVTFNNDLTVSIEEFGREMDVGNLSRGESTRVILALSFAFRDVWENLIMPVNITIVDELADAGLDTSGADSVLALLKSMSRDRSKSVWLISHRDDFISRVDNILKVKKENGFSVMAADI